MNKLWALVTLFRMNYCLRHRTPKIAWHCSECFRESLEERDRATKAAIEALSNWGKG